MPNQYYAQKLDHIDQYLLACGWTPAGEHVRENSGGVAIPHFAVPNALIDATGAEYNRGCSFARAAAIMIQVQFDEACKARMEQGNE